MTLFDPLRVEPDSPMRLDEDNFAYLSRSDRPSMASVREVLDRWCAEVPPAQRQNVMGRLRSGDDEQFISAFWEMYLATLFREAGFTVTWEPTLTHHMGLPDFLLERSDCCFYLEATSVGGSRAALGAQQRTRAAYQAIRRWDSPDFALGLTVYAVGPANLSVTQARRPVETWLASLDADAVLLAQGEGGYFEVPHYRLAQAGWDIAVHAVPRTAATRGSGQETLAAYSTSVGGLIENTDRLRRSAEGKAKKYGRLSHPLVLAVLSNTDFATSQHQVASALWGPWEQRPDGAISLLPVQQNQPTSASLWRTDRGPRYGRVAGVLVGTFIHPWNLSEALPTLWTNSQAEPPLTCALGLGTWAERESVVTYSQGRLSAPTALGLPRDLFTDDV